MDTKILSFFKENNCKIYEKNCLTTSPIGYYCPCNIYYEISYEEILEGNQENICGKYCKDKISKCSKTQKKLCENNNCIVCFERSFSSQPKAKFWSKDNKITPRQITKSSHKKFLFDCDGCSHSFDISLDKITYSNQWCQYCAHRKLCEDDNCDFCFNNSFASHPKAKFWSKKNNKTVRQIFKNSNEKWLFDCDKCPHTFEMALDKINDDHWCYYCSKSNGKLCDKDDCYHCFERSFASSDKAKFWSTKNNKSPRNVFKSSKEIFLFDCDECLHTFDSQLNYITKGQW